jgi:hypothetical protein
MLLMSNTQQKSCILIRFLTLKEIYCLWASLLMSIGAFSLSLCGYSALSISLNISLKLTDISSVSTMIYVFVLNSRPLRLQASASLDDCKALA